MTNKKTADSVQLLSPFVYLRPSVRMEAFIVLFLLSLQVLMLFVTKSYGSLLIVLSSLLASFSADFIMAKKKFSDSFEVVSVSTRALIISLLIPSGFPPVAVFFITFSVLFINRLSLGGFANSWINPAAVIVAICWIVGMKFFPDIRLSVTDLQSKNIALSLIHDGTFPLNSCDVAVTNFLNKKLFSLFGISIPEGYFSLFWDSHSSIPAFRFNLLTLLSSIVLLGSDVLNPIIPAVFIFTYSILVKFFAPFFYNGTMFQGDVILALLSSGTLFCTFFLLQWHGTTPFSNRGRFFYGFFAGILAFFIMGIGLSPAGFAFIVLITNMISLFIQSIENRILGDYTKNVILNKVRLVKEGCDA